MSADGPASRAEIDVQMAASGVLVPSGDDIERWARAATCERAAGEPAPELTVRVIDEHEMTELNERYRHKRGSTNVLSFAFEMPDSPWPDDAPAMNLLGDVVVCHDVVTREAQAQGKALDAHFAHMVVHGVLHLRGYDHEDDAQAAKMEDEERRVLAALGFDDPYAVEGRAGASRRGASSPPVGVAAMLEPRAMSESRDSPVREPKPAAPGRTWLDRIGQAFGAEPQDRAALVAMLRDCERRGLVDADALAMAEGALHVGDLQVRDIMVPRAQMVVIEEALAPEAFVGAVIESGHSRFPVIGDSRDEVRGILLAKDLAGVLLVR